MKFLEFALYAVIIAIIITGVLYFIFHVIIWPFRKRDLIYSIPLQLEELLITLNLIITTEEKLYDDYIFTSAKAYSSMSNAEYENAYRDLCENILTSVSPDLWDLFSIYMTRESIQTYVTEQVHNYLALKINGPAL